MNVRSLFIKDASEEKAETREIVWRDWLWCILYPYVISVYHLPNTMIPSSLVIIPVFLFIVLSFSFIDNVTLPTAIFANGMGIKLPVHQDLNMVIRKLGGLYVKALVFSWGRFPNCVHGWLPPFLLVHLIAVCLAFFVLFTARRFYALAGNPPRQTGKKSKFLVTICPSAQVWLRCEKRQSCLHFAMFEMMAMMGLWYFLSSANFAAGLSLLFSRSFSLEATDQKYAIRSGKTLQMIFYGASFVCLIVRVVLSVLAYKWYC